MGTSESQALADLYHVYVEDEVSCPKFSNFFSCHKEVVFKRTGPNEGAGAKLCEYVSPLHVSGEVFSLDLQPRGQLKSGLGEVTPARLDMLTFLLFLASLYLCPIPVFMLLVCFLSACALSRSLPGSRLACVLPLGTSLLAELSELGLCEALGEERR